MIRQLKQGGVALMLDNQENPLQKSPEWIAPQSKGGAIKTTSPIVPGLLRKTTVTPPLVEEVNQLMQEGMWKITIEGDGLTGLALFHAAVFSYRACYHVYPATVILSIN